MCGGIFPPVDSLNSQGSGITSSDDWKLEHKMHATNK